MSRTLHEGETSEVQVYLGGGDDRVTTPGRRTASRSGSWAGRAMTWWTTRRAAARGSAATAAPPSCSRDRALTSIAGSTARRRRPRTRPGSRRATGDATRSSLPGSPTAATSARSWALAADTRAFGFRKDPYASRHSLRAGWAFGEKHVPRRLPRRVPDREPRLVLGLVRLCLRRRDLPLLRLRQRDERRRRPAGRLLQGQAEPVRVHADPGAAVRPRLHALPRARRSSTARTRTWTTTRS